MFGDDDLHVMFGMIHMRDHRHNAGNETVFCDRFRGKDAEARIACKVSAAADPVHDPGPHDVGGVHISVEIRFDGCVQGNDTQAADDLWMV